MEHMITDDLSPLFECKLTTNADLEIKLISKVLN